MTIETDIRARLVADGTVSGLVSTRVYPAVLPQSPTYPALTYQRISGPRDRELSGADGWARLRLQIDSWSTTYVECQSLAAAVRASLHGFQSAIVGNYAAIGLENETDAFEDDAADGDGGNGVYRITQDYVITHEET